MCIDRKPVCGILAFMIVLLAMPLGHALMVLTQVLLGPGGQFIGDTDTQPQLTLCFPD